MSKKGHYPGGHTLLGPKSSWFGNAEQARKQTKMLQEGHLAHEEHLRKAAEKEARRAEDLKQPLERQDRERKARATRIAEVERKLADPACQESQRAAHRQTKSYQTTEQRMAKVVVVRTGKRPPKSP